MSATGTGWWSTSIFRSSSTASIHQRLLSRLGQKVADSRILKLIGRILKAKVVLPDGTRVCTDEGTPQGGPLSPLLSNVVLGEFHKQLARRGLCFVCYADNCNIFV
jgi:retron-type reverse transcriptase